MADANFDFQKFINDSRDVLIKPKEYYARMEKTGGIAEPIIKALIYGTAAGIISFLWAVLGIGVVGSFGSAALGGGIGIMTLIGSVIGSIIALFIGGLVILVISAICSGSTDFEHNVRVCASTMVLYPVGAILGVLNVLGMTGFYIEAVLSLAVKLYGLWLLYNALVYSLNGKENVARILSIIFAVIPVLLLISTLTCSRIAKSSLDNFSKDSKKNSEDIQKSIDQLNKLMK